MCIGLQKTNERFANKKPSTMDLYTSLCPILRFARCTYRRPHVGTSHSRVITDLFACLILSVSHTMKGHCVRNNVQIFLPTSKSNFACLDYVDEGKIFIRCGNVNCAEEGRAPAALWACTMMIPLA